MKEESSGVIRNVWLHDHRDGLVGGVWQSGSITNQLFYDMIDIVTLIKSEYVIHRRVGEGPGPAIQRDRQTLALGLYVILAPDGSPVADMEINKEPVHSRIPPGSVTPRAFGDSIRNRDTRCVLSGVETWRGDYSGFDTAHIFPGAYEQEWLDNGYRRWVVNPQEVDERSSLVDSPRNGFLLSASVHIRWDAYKLAVDPDNRYLIFDFAGNQFRCDGKVLDPMCRRPDDPNRVSDEVLRWHFRQCILRNVRGAGEPTRECNLPAGTDTIRKILQGHDPVRRMEVELTARLGPYVERRETEVNRWRLSRPTLVPYLPGDTCAKGV